MTSYSVLGINNTFQTDNDFYKAIRNQAFGKTEVSFYNIHYPLSYFYFSWSDGYLFINFHNTLTNRSQYICLNKKNLSYSLFTELKQSILEYYLITLYCFPFPPRKTFWQKVRDLIRRRVFGICEE